MTIPFIGKHCARKIALLLSKAATCAKWLMARHRLLLTEVPDHWTSASDQMGRCSRQKGAFVDLGEGIFCSIFVGNGCDVGFSAVICLVIPRKI